MSADLFNERFFSYRELPWHELGKISEVPQRAVEAWSGMTPYSIVMRDLLLRTRTNTRGPIVSGYRAIVREPVPDDPEDRVFGVVKSDYELIEPQEICEIFDSSTKLHVETMGCLGAGELFFLTTKLPGINVKGDKVDVYLLWVSPYNGYAAIEVRVTPVRTVCRNTLITARAASTEFYRIVHNKDARKRLQVWTTGIVQRSQRRAETLEQAFKMFAQYQPSQKVVPAILTQVYPDPKPINEVPDDEVMVKRQNEFDYQSRAQDQFRQMVQELFNGRGTGMDNKACRGTGWGLYNSITELENFRRSGTDIARAKGVLFGPRASTMERAYDVIYEYAERGTK